MTGSPSPGRRAPRPDQFRRAGATHFACHNTFSSDGSFIDMDGGRFKPALLAEASIRKLLEETGPLVFINACRSAGAAPTYTKMLGWAQQFMASGAGAFVGTLWAVRSDSSVRFATAFYRSSPRAPRWALRHSPPGGTSTRIHSTRRGSPTRSTATLRHRRLDRPAAALPTRGPCDMDVTDDSVPVEELVSAVKDAVKQAGISTTDVGATCGSDPFS
ncbi:CHAT domain-containing protein [Micromonospora sp. M12]